MSFSDTRPDKQYLLAPSRPCRSVSPAGDDVQLTPDLSCA